MASAIYAACALANAAAQSASGGGAGVPDTLGQRVIACTSCHGQRGAGSPGGRAGPRIAGQPAAYLALQLTYFQSGQRKNDAMQYITQPLTPAYAREIAEYFASQVVVGDAAKVAAPADGVMPRGEDVVLRGDPSRGVPPCASCHGSRLTGREPLIPGLTSLSYRYLASQFAQWRSHSRAADRPYCMSVVANRMSEAEIDAAARWLANRQAADVLPGDAAMENDPPLPDWCVMDEAGGEW
ncbi:c-type cytochrome [Dyella sp. EPa41]|uniref:c-type cytochrome n=1 Tax=Dyella sp. EPa41 TaxID=1561194 RepID=UPI001F1F1B52|nr:c-type cytochrome [Dyella sp. EPa41]